MSNHKSNALREETRKIAELTELAEQEDAKAQYLIGMEITRNSILFYDPDDAELDDRKRLAAEWFKKAAEKGHARAMFNLGTYYFFNSEVSPEDEPKALAWLNLAAELGVHGTISSALSHGINVTTMTDAQFAEAEALLQEYREAYGQGLQSGPAPNEEAGPAQDEPTQNHNLPAPGF